MDKRDINSRLSDLGIYSEYYYRREIKPLSQIINFDEKLNCVFTGFFEGQRRMVAVTDYRIIIIATPTLGQTEIKIIKRKAVKGYNFSKRFLVSSVEINTTDDKYVFKQVQAARKKLFDWAMGEPVKEFDE